MQHEHRPLLGIAISDPLKSVALLIIANSRIVVLLPICTMLFPENFKSWGIDDITAPGNIQQLYLFLRRP